MPRVPQTLGYRFGKFATGMKRLPEHRCGLWLVRLFATHFQSFGSWRILDMVGGICDELRILGQKTFVVTGESTYELAILAVFGTNLGQVAGFIKARVWLAHLQSSGVERL